MQNNNAKALRLDENGDNMTAEWPKYCMKEKFFMREIVCDEKECRERIDISSEAILDNGEEIKDLKEDTKKGIQRYPSDNEEIIKATPYANFNHYLNNAS